MRPTRATPTVTTTHGTGEAMRKKSSPAPPSLFPPPLPTPVIANLYAVSPGPDAIYTTHASRDQITEWTSGWLAADELRAAGAPPPGPLLLHGPPGSGKTTVTAALARAFAARGTHVLALDATRVTSQFQGQTAAQLSAAADAARRAQVALVLEEIDSLASARSYRSGAELESTRTTNALMRVLELDMPLIATTNRLDVLDPAVERRFEYIVEMPAPDYAAQRVIVARLLGLDLLDFELCSFAVGLTTAVKLARRARRRAVLDGVSVTEAFEQLVKAALP